MFPSLPIRIECRIYNCSFLNMHTLHPPIFITSTSPLYPSLKSYHKCYVKQSTGVRPPPDPLIPPLCAPYSLLLYSTLTLPTLTLLALSLPGHSFAEPPANSTLLQLVVLSGERLSHRYPSTSSQRMSFQSKGSKLPDYPQLSHEARES